METTLLHVPVSVAARLIGVSKNTAFRMVTSGRLVRSDPGEGVTLASVEAVKAERAERAARQAALAALEASGCLLYTSPSPRDS